MAVTPEQRALLELVHDRGLTYEEIGELTGEGTEGARTRVEAAEAARRGGEPRDDSAAPRRAPIALVVVALAGLALLAGVLALAGVFSGDGEEMATPLVTEPANADQEVTRIELTGAAGSQAQGSIAVGIGADSSPYLDLDLTGLEPAPAGGFHMLWVELEGGRGVPLPDPIVVAGDGSFRERFELPAEAAGILEVGRALEVVLTDQAAIERVTRDVSRAQRGTRPGQLDPSDLPQRPGEAVLRGEIGT